MKYQIINEQFLLNIPCEDKLCGYIDLVWRYNHNPFILRDLIPSSKSTTMTLSAHGTKMRLIAPGRSTRAGFL